MRSLFTILLLLMTFAVKSQGELQVHSFESLDSLQQQEQRPVLVFIHTDWCKFCKAMKARVFTDEKVQATLDNEFYFVMLDGESRAPIKFRGHTFNFRPTGNNVGVHELAEAIGTIEGKLEYPTLVVMNSTYEILFQHAAFLNKKQLLRVLSRVEGQ